MDYKYNKKTIKFLSLLVVALLFSCSSDDGGSPISGEKLIGKWKQISERENGVDQVLTTCDLM